MSSSPVDSNWAAIVNKRQRSSALKGEKSATAPSSSEDEIVYVLPPRFTFVREALVPMVKSLRGAMEQVSGLSRQEFVMPESFYHHSRAIQRFLERLPSRVEGLNSDSVNGDESDIAQVYRAAGRLEEVLSEWVDGYQEVKASHAQPDAGEVRDLLVGVYRHHLLEVCNWLEDLVNVIGDPATAMAKKGLSIRNGATLTVSLSVTVPPEMDKLLAIAKRMQINATPELEPTPASPRSSQSAPGILGTMGALAFGIGITEAVLGRHRG